MSFTCPDCRTTGSLQIRQSLEIESDARSDEIMLQVVECRQCSFTALAVYEESRRGPLDSESYEHTGFRVAGTELEEVIQWVDACPEPTNHRCRCLVHREMNQKDDAGNWNGRNILRRYDVFSMELS